MTIKLLLFASLADLLGFDEAELEVPEGLDRCGLVEHLEEAFPTLARFERRYRVAFNQEFVGPDESLPDGAEVALIPPVSGGSGPRLHSAVRESPLAVDPALETVRRTHCGAVVLFLGTVRDLTGSERTEKLEYSAYRGMAESELARLVQEASERWELGGAWLEHRVGELDPGEIAVVVAVSAPHRDAAFEAGRFLIDTAKERVPLWKKEFGSDGAVWIEGDARTPVNG